MADRTSLGILGFIFCAVTLAVLLTAAVVTKASIDGRLALGPIMTASLPASVR
jgi:hypothetical protein